MKKASIIIPASLVGLMAFTLLVPVGALAASSRSAGTFTGVPVTGTTSSGPMTGTLDITSFANQNDQLVAMGLLSGTVPDGSGKMQTITKQPVILPVTAQGTCQILTLTLGPLDLNILGLMIHLDKVVLTITAQTGPGNLLGNLLCGIAHLLDPESQPHDGPAVSTSQSPAFTHISRKGEPHPPCHTGSKPPCHEEPEHCEHGEEPEHCEECNDVLFDLICLLTKLLHLLG